MVAVVLFGIPPTASMEVALIAEISDDSIATPKPTCLEETKGDGLVHYQQ
jgi:hypothetical protein